LNDDFSIVFEKREEIFKLIEKKSGTKLNLKSKFSNPDYLQLKIQYSAIIGRNWVKVDITKSDLVEEPVKKSVKRIYSDMNQIFPKDLKETLLPYWERELGRLVYPLPDLELVLKELRKTLKSYLLPLHNDE